MINQINLIPKDTHQISDTVRTIKILKIVSRGIAIAMAIVIVLEYTWVFKTKSDLDQIQNQISALQASLTEQFPVELRYLHDQQVLKQAGTVLNQRKDFQSVLSSLYTLLPAGVSIEGLNFSDRALLLTAKTADVQSFAAVLENVKTNSTANNKAFGDAVLGSARRSENGAYSFSLQLEVLNPL